MLTMVVGYYCYRVRFALVLGARRDGWRRIDAEAATNNNYTVPCIPATTTGGPRHC